MSFHSATMRTAIFSLLDTELFDLAMNGLLYLYLG